MAGTGESVELATAYLQIIPSMKGVRDALERELGGVDTRPAEKSIVSRLGGAFRTVGKIAATALGAVGTIALAGGLASIAKEAINASDATKKFKSTLNFAGLASADVDRLTASTKKYADQTVYDLGDIQNVTAQLAANNVAGYDRLAEAAGNLNAVAGGNADTFKSVGMVLTQTAGQGKLTTENFNQLSDAIPGASGKIQEALAGAGAYVGNFRDAMQKGEITAAEFNQAIMDLGMTDAAQEAATSTQTMEGAWGNFQASLTSGAMEIADQVMPYLTSALSSAADGATKAFSWVQSDLIPGLKGVWDILTKGDFTGPIFGMEEDSTLVDWLFRLREAGEAVWGALLKLKDAALALWGRVEPLATAAWDLGKSLGGDLLTSIKDAASWMETLFGWVSRNSGVVGTLAAAIGGGAASVKIGTTAVKAYTKAQEAVKAVNAAGSIMKFVKATKFATTAQKAFNIVFASNPLGAVVTVIAAAVAGLVYFFTQTETGKRLWQELTQALNNFIGWIGSAWSSTLEAVSEWWTSTWSTVKDIFQSYVVEPLTTGWDTVTGAFSSFIGWVGDVWDSAWQGVAEVFQSYVVEPLSAAWDGIVSVFRTAMDIIGAVWDGIVTGAKLAFAVIATVVLLPFKLAIDALGAVFTWLWENAVRPAWEGIKSLLSAAWEGTIKPIWDAFKNALGAVGDAVMSLWNDYVVPAWDGIISAVSVAAGWVADFLSGIWNGIKDVVSSVWNAISDTISTVWEGIKTVVSVAVGWVSEFVSNTWEGIKVIASAVWNAISDTISGVWEGIKNVVSVAAGWVSDTLSGIWNSIRDTVSSVWNAISDTISGVWDGIKTTASTAVNWVKDTVSNVFTNLKDGVQSIFDGMKNAISTVWESVKGVVAKPVNFIIKTVYTNGIKWLFDKVAETVGLDTRLPDVQPIEGYASGGVLPGYTPGRDVYHFVSRDGGGRLALSGGEAIMVPEWTRAVGGPRAVAAMNAAARRTHGRGLSGRGDVGRGYAFAEGGIWDRITSGLSSAWDAVKNFAATAADIISDPVGAVTHLIREPVNELLGGIGVTGTWADILKSVPGVLMDAFGDFFTDETKGMTGSDAVDYSRTLLGTPYVWGGSSIPPGLDCSGLIYYSLNKTGHPAPRLTAAGYQAVAAPVAWDAKVPGDILLWGNPAHHIAWYSGGGMMIEEPHEGASAREVPIWGSPTVGRLTYDDGGWLQPGTTVVDNKSNRPEPVFSAGQWGGINRLVELLESERGRELVVRDVDDELVGRMRVEADGRILEAQALGL